MDIGNKQRVILVEPLTVPVVDDEIEVPAASELAAADEELAPMTRGRTAEPTAASPRSK